MSKQLVFIHGGETFDTYDHYINWLTTTSTFDPERYNARAKRWHRNLETFLPGWVILRPQMPNEVNAQYNEWEVYFEKVIPYLQDKVVLIGHSLGGTFLLKYLATHELPVQASVHLVAPSFGVLHTSFDVTENLSIISSRVRSCTVHHSTDDMVVPYQESKEGVLHIHGAQLRTYTDRGHFLGESFPELINEIAS